MEPETSLRQIAEKQIAEWEAAIAALDAERARMLEQLQQIEHNRRAMLRVKETLEAVRDWNGRTTKPTPVRVHPAEPKGSMAVRQAVIEVLKEAQGQPLHSRLILGRVRAKGAIIDADDPVGVIDLAAYNIRDRNLAPLAKVGPRTWRYVGPPAEDRALAEVPGVNGAQEGVQIDA